MTYFCKYCNTEHNAKGFPSHLRTHNILFMDYVTQNLDLFENYHICPVCNLNVCENSRGKWPGTCSRKCRGQYQSQQQTGRVGWSRGLTKHDHPGLESMAQKAAVRHKGLSPLRFWSDEKKIEFRKKLSEIAKIRMRGAGNPMFGKTHTPEAIQKIISQRGMTNIEKKIGDFLKENSIEFYFQFFINSDSKHSYDFKIKGIPLIIETDGDYWHGGPGCEKHFFKVEECKFNDVLKTKIAKEHGYDIIRFWQSEIEQNFDLVKNKILTEINNRKI